MAVKKDLQTAATVAGEAEMERVEQEFTNEEISLKTAQKGVEKDMANDLDEYRIWAYVGPSLPNGKLKSNAILKGTLSEIHKYYEEVLLEYPQVEKMIVPIHKLGAVSLRARTPGNVAHKYYNDIVSAMHNEGE